MLILQAVSDEDTRGPVNYYLVPQTTLEAFHILTDNQECNNNNELCLAIYKSQKLDADELRFYKLQVRVTVSLFESFIYYDKPGPPHFARSTILVISPSDLPKNDLKKVLAEDISYPVWLREMQHYNIDGDR